MKIKVSDLEPNPFRMVDRFPIDPHKVEDLKFSINQTGFWDNLLARPNPQKKGKYQLSYGLTRLTAIKDLGIEEIDIPVRDIDDATMIQIMASENMNQFGTLSAIVSETVLISKQFIESAISKYGTWESFKNNGNGVIVSSFLKAPNPENLFNKTKNDGANWIILKCFLGDNWKEWKLRTALEYLENEEINKEAVEMFGSMSDASEFVHLMTKAKVPKNKQVGIAKTTIEKREKRKSDTGSKSPIGANTPQKKFQLHMDIYSSAPEFFTEEIDIYKEAEKKLRIWQTKIKSLRGDTYELNEILDGIGKEPQLHGPYQFISLDEITQLFEELNRLLPKLGIFLKNRIKLDAISE